MDCKPKIAACARGATLLAIVLISITDERAARAADPSGACERDASRPGWPPGQAGGPARGRDRSDLLFDRVSDFE